MANTITSKNGTVDGTTITWKTHFKKDGVYLYVTYDKGDGNYVILTPSFIETGLGATQFVPVYIDTDGISALAARFKIASTMNPRIPIPLSQGEKTLKIAVAFNGGATQTLNIDLRND